MVLAALPAFGQPVNPQPGWADSYERGGICYIRSTLDHNVGPIVVSTPVGNRTVAQVLIAQNRANVPAYQIGDPLYNDVQCGNGPANDNGDENPGNCPGRVDQGSAGCNVIGPRWDLKAIFGNDEPTQVSVDGTSTRDPEANATKALIFRGRSARAQLAAVWSGTMDCDPINGVMTCANYRLGVAAPPGVPTLVELTGDAGSTTDTDTDTDTPTPAPPNPDVVLSGGTIRIEAESDTAANWRADAAGYIEWQGGNFFFGPHDGESLKYSFTAPSTGTYYLRLRAKANQQTPNRVDLHNDVFLRLDGANTPGERVVTDWVKVFSSGNGQWEIRNGNFTQNLTGGVTYLLEALGRSTGYAIDYFELVKQGGDPGLATQASEPTTGTGNGEPIPPVPFMPANSRRIAFYADTFNDAYVCGDLLSLHYDSSFDPDDLQAMILAREMLDSGDPCVDYIAVNGTKNRDHTFVLDGSTEHMLNLFPDGYDAFNNCGLSHTTLFCSDTLNEVATSWQITLEGGQRVHVAEGGPSSFTADVVRTLINRGVSNANLKKIRVIQHSWGFNEINTRDDDLELIQRYTQYISIANGNQGFEGGGHTLTSDFNFERTANAATFRRLALNSQYRSEWAYAFNAINDKVDGSDAVEVMWILGINRNFSPDLLQFAKRYF